LESFDCIQNVDQPTHKDGHTLDLVITNSDTVVTDVMVGGSIADHALITFGVCTVRPAVEYSERCGRLWSRMDMDKFADDLVNSALYDVGAFDGLSADELATLYNDTLSSLIDKHCPPRIIRCKVVKLSAWFDSECRARRRDTRRTEKMHRRTHSSEDRLAWIQQLKSLHRLYECKSCQYWRVKIEDSSGNSRKLWQSISLLMGKVNGKKNVDDSHTADKFAGFFQQKIEAIRSETETAKLPEILDMKTNLLNCWSPVTAYDVDKLITAAPNKTCQLDPIPTWLVKKVSGLLAPFVAVLINASLSSGQFPDCFKQAIVVPLLKKNNLDSSEMKNYRPVSNLPFVSKLLEKVVQLQLQSHLSSSGLMPPTQSAYRANYSTETALLKIFNDMLLAADRGEATALCMLDLSAAFDTVDHEVLLTKLQRMFGVSGTALNWLKSYLMNRSYSHICWVNLISGHYHLLGATRISTGTFALYPLRS